MRRRLAPWFLFVSSCRSAPEPSPPPSVAPTPEARRSPEPASELPAGVAAIVDDVEIRDEQVVALATKLEREDAARGSAPLDADARIGLQRWVLAAMIDAQLVRHEAARLGVEPDSRDGELVAKFASTSAERGERDFGWMDDEHARYEAAVARGRGLLDVDEASIAAAYERNAPRWTSAEPWIDAELESIRWQEPIGVPACDAYVAAYHHCIDRDVPSAARRQMMDSLDRMAREWQETARDRTKHDSLVVACGAARDAAMQATRSLCDWTKPPPKGAAGKAAARREAMARRKAASQSLQDEPPEDDGPSWGSGNASKLRPAGELPAPLAAVAKRQPVGRVSAPIEHDRAFWLVTLMKRWPAGTLPLEAVRETIASEVLLERFASAHDELPMRLRAAHRVVVRASPQ